MDGIHVLDFVAYLQKYPYLKYVSFGYNSVFYPVPQVVRRKVFGSGDCHDEALYSRLSTVAPMWGQTIFQPQAVRTKKLMIFHDHADSPAVFPGNLPIVCWKGFSLEVEDFAILN